MPRAGECLTVTYYSSDAESMGTSMDRVISSPSEIIMKLLSFCHE